eukprot:gene18556-biopygen3948
MPGQRRRDPLNPQNSLGSSVSPALVPVFMWRAGRGPAPLWKARIPGLSKEVLHHAQPATNGDWPVPAPGDSRDPRRSRAAAGLKGSGNLGAWTVPPDPRGSPGPPGGWPGDVHGGAGQAPKVPATSCASLWQPPAPSAGGAGGGTPQKMVSAPPPRKRAACSATYRVEINCFGNFRITAKGSVYWELRGIEGAIGLNGRRREDVITGHP